MKQPSSPLKVQVQIRPLVSQLSPLMFLMELCCFQSGFVPQTSKSVVKCRVATSFTLKCSPDRLLLVELSLFVVGKITDLYRLILFVRINHHLY